MAGSQTRSWQLLFRFVWSLAVVIGFFFSATTIYAFSFGGSSLGRCYKSNLEEYEKVLGFNENDKGQEAYKVVKKSFEEDEESTQAYDEIGKVQGAFLDKMGIGYNRPASAVFSKGPNGEENTEINPGDMFRVDMKGLSPKVIAAAFQSLCGSIPAVVPQRSGKPKALDGRDRKDFDAGCAAAQVSWVHQYENFWAKNSMTIGRAASEMFSDSERGGGFGSGGKKNYLQGKEIDGANDVETNSMLQLSQYYFIDRGLEKYLDTHYPSSLARLPSPQGPQHFLIVNGEPLYAFNTGKLDESSPYPRLLIGNPFTFKGPSDSAEKYNKLFGMTE